MVFFDFDFQPLKAWRSLYLGTERYLTPPDGATISSVRPTAFSSIPDHQGNVSSGGRVLSGPGGTHSPSRSLHYLSISATNTMPVIRALLLTRMHSTGTSLVRDWSLITGKGGTTE